MSARRPELTLADGASASGRSLRPPGMTSRARAPYREPGAGGLRRWSAEVVGPGAPFDQGVVQPASALMVGNE